MSRPTGGPRWYSSLYWRMALGLIAFFALMLSAQSGMFLWLANQSAGSMPARSPRRLAVLVGSDLSSAINANPAVDLEQYIHEQYGQVFQPFVVIMRDGRIIANHGAVPPELEEAVHVESERRDPPPREGRRGSFEGRRPGEGPPLPPERSWESAPIFGAGGPIGRVAVYAGSPMRQAIRELGPSMAVVGIAILATGMILIALFVFGPAQRRLKQLELATERLGAGDLDARAPETGRDEVTAVAHAFNRMAEELKSRAHALEASDRARRQLLADVSHELMTPLTAIRGYVETLAMPDVPIDPSTRTHYLGIIDDETHRLERVIGDLLDLARLEGGGSAIKRAPVAVRALFDRVASRHGRALAAQNIRLTTVIDRGADHVVGDVDRLEQALQNLTANAIRHTPNGGEISLVARAEGDTMLLRVRDTGPGIAEQHLPLIFDRFYKADAARKASGGSGLGLSIVKAIVEQHGGTIAVANDDGAVFDIRLPVGSPIAA